MQIFCIKLGSFFEGWRKIKYQNTFGFGYKHIYARTYTHTLPMGEWGSSNEMPFNIVWNFSLAFFHRSFTCILGGCFWIFHYLMNSYEFGKWKAISHVHAQAKRRHTYNISSKNKVILIIITNRFFLFIFGPFFFFCRSIVPSILWYFICFICCGPHFSFVDFLSFCYLILVFRLCDFVILPQFE